MHFRTSNRALLQSMLACALILAGSAGCQRPAGRESAVQIDATGGSANLSESERIRPPEDSTEIRGTGITAETADEEPVKAGQ